jgi:hypothetical protein
LGPVWKDEEMRTLAFFLCVSLCPFALAAAEDEAKPKETLKKESQEAAIGT